MVVKFWGTRGTFPIPGPGTVRYGGDTTCVSLETDDRVLVIDTGTGVRALGKSLEGDRRDIAVLFTHIHADHVMGFPYFMPLYEKGRLISVLDHRLGDIEWSATGLLDGMHFPLTVRQLPCDMRRISSDPLEFLAEFGFSLTRTLLNHPGGAYGYRVQTDAKSFVFIPDNELAPQAEPVVARDRLIEFCAGADVLAHDGQFTDEEMEKYCGWGHSTVTQAVDLAVEAEVGSLLLTHHDPYRTDEGVDELEEIARRHVGDAPVEVRAAHDGLRFTI